MNKLVVTTLIALGSATGASGQGEADVWAVQRTAVRHLKPRQITLQTFRILLDTTGSPSLSRSPQHATQLADSAGATVARPAEQLPCKVFTDCQIAENTKIMLISEPRIVGDTASITLQFFANFHASDGRRGVHPTTYVLRMVRGSKGWEVFWMSTDVS